MLNEIDDRNCVNCELKCEIFKLLTKDELELVNKNRSVANYKIRENIFKQGAPTTHVIFLTHGIVKIYIEGYGGKELILNIVKPTQFISGPGLYVNNLYPFSCRALTETQACFVDGNIFKQLIRQNVTFAEGFIQEFSRKSLGTMHSFVNLTQKKMPGRIADGLIYLAESIHHSNKFEMVLSKKELGDLTAMTKESAQRILKDFQEEGIISFNGNHFEIKKMEKLRQISAIG